MMAQIDTGAIEEARHNGRNGAARDERPDEVEDFLADEVEVGFENGLPILDKDYGEYCENILSPTAGSDVKEVAEHDLVSSSADVANELNTRTSKAIKALDIHDIEEPKGNNDFDVPAVAQEGVIEVPLMGEVNTDYLRNNIYTDARLLEHLYIRCGMSVAEIKEVLEDGMNEGRDGDKSAWGVTKANIRNALEDVSLIEPDDTRRGEDDDIRLGGTTIHNSETSERTGLTVNASDF